MHGIRWNRRRLFMRILCFRSALRLLRLLLMNQYACMYSTLRSSTNKYFEKEKEGSISNSVSTRIGLKIQQNNSLFTKKELDE